MFFFFFDFTEISRLHLGFFVKTDWEPWSVAVRYPPVMVEAANQMVGGAPYMCFLAHILM